MSDKFEEKNYKKDDKIELRIELDEYVFLPYYKVKGNIFLKKKDKDFKCYQKEVEIVYKVTQFQYYENPGSKGDKSKLKIDKITEKRTHKVCQNNFLENEESFPIELDLPGDEIKNFYPSFEYRNKGFSLFVRHLLTIELPELNTSNSTGIIIGKLPEKINNILKVNDLESNCFRKVKKENIKKLLSNKGTLEYDFQIKKLIYSLTEEIPVKAKISKDLKDIEIDSIELVLEKKLKIKQPASLQNLKFWEENEGEKEETMFKEKYKGDEIKKNNMSFSLNLEIDKDEFPLFISEFDQKEKSEVSKKEIKRFIKFDENFVERDERREFLNPSINTELFSCEYRAKLNILFKNKTVFDKSEEFIIDLYTIKPSVIDKILENYFKTHENPLFDEK